LTKEHINMEIRSEENTLTANGIEACNRRTCNGMAKLLADDFSKVRKRLDFHHIQFYLSKNLKKAFSMINFHKNLQKVNLISFSFSLS